MNHYETRTALNILCNSFVALNPNANRQGVNDLNERVRVLLQNQWAIDVLDAWCDLEPSVRSHRTHGMYVAGRGRVYHVMVAYESGARQFGVSHATRDQARLSAALEVKDMLPPSALAKIGVCP